MIYKFKSKAGSDVIMMGPNGDEVLRLIGKSPAPQGILEAAAMPTAIQALERALASDEPSPQPAEAGDGDAPGEAAKESPVGLRQRAWPLLELMKRAQPLGLDIVWGV